MGGVEAESEIFLGNVFRKGNRRITPAVFLSLHFPPGLERPFYISVFPRRTFVLYFRIPTSNIRSTHLPGQWQDYRGTGEVCQVANVI